MLKTVIETGGGGTVVLMDSITKVSCADAGAIVVSASHGGASSGEFALAVPLRAVFFNDAGVGKDNAGIAALTMLQARGIAAGTVSHESARIGDALDTWESGVISHLNDAARQLGIEQGRLLRDSLRQLLSCRRPVEAP